MPGEIHPAVVATVIGGLRRAAPELLGDPAEVDALLAYPHAVPLEPYRAVLDRVAAARPAALVEAGFVVAELTHPFLFVLLNSGSPAQVIDKLRRLGRFIHSRHRTEVVASEPDRLVLDHVSSVDEPPRPSEDLAAFGQHLALLEEIGCRGLRARFPKGPTPERWVVVGGRCAPLDPDGDYSRWELAWDELVPTRRPMPGLDALLLAGVDEPAMREAPRVVQRIEAVVRRDLARSWRLVEVARALDTPPRSLQRELSRAGTSWTRELDRVRVDEATRLLLTDDLSLTEIGYVCGFSDSAHFHRRFKKRYGCSPGEHRRARGAQRGLRPSS